MAWLQLVHKTDRDRQTDRFIGRGRLKTWSLCALRRNVRRRPRHSVGMVLARPFMAVMLPLPLPMSLYGYRSRLVLPAMLHSGGSEEELAALTVVALKQRLRELGRPVSGKKADLIARVRGEAAVGADPTARLPAPAAAASSSPPSSSSSSAASARSIVPMDATPRRRRGGAEEPARSLRAVSWNVAGLRGLLKREEGRATLRHLIASEQVDVLMLQATALHCYLLMTSCYLRVTTCYH